MCQLGAMIAVGGCLHIRYLFLLEFGKTIQGKETTSCSNQTLNPKHYKETMSEFSETCPNQDMINDKKNDRKLSKVTES